MDIKKLLVSFFQKSEKIIGDWFYIFNDPEVIFFVEQLWVMHGLIGQEKANGRKYNYGEPYTCNRVEYTVFGKFFAKDIEQVKD